MAILGNNLKYLWAYYTLQVWRILIAKPSLCHKPLMAQYRTILNYSVKDAQGLIDLAVKTPRSNTAPIHYSKCVIYN